ncbi:MAG: hypothetical protein ACJA0C_000912 [Candidatus Endobugula sp.]|jgi:hypothetical protein
MSQQNDAENSTENSINHATELAHWQQGFYDALLGELSPDLQQSFQTTSNKASQQRFAIYQNNVFYSLTTALGDLYPVVKKLVGDDFFTGTAGIYFRQHPPQQAAMVFLGEKFADFLCNFEHTKTMAYLPDVAALELARHRAYHARDKTALTTEVIALIAPEVLAQSLIELHPSLQCIQSPEPIFSIWQNNQEETNDSQKTVNQQASVQLGEPQQVLIVRPVYSINMYQVPDDIYAFIQYLQQGCTLAEAIENTLDKHADFDVGNSIQFALHTQLFSDIISS